MNKQKVVRFLKENRIAIVQMSIMTGSVLFANSGFANDMSNTKIAISSLDTPLNVLKDFLTGPLPKIATLAGVATGAASWTMGLDQQVSKWGVRSAMGGGISMGAGEAISSVTGCLF